MALFNLFSWGANGHLVNVSWCGNDCKQMSLLSPTQSADYGWVWKQKSTWGWSTVNKRKQGKDKPKKHTKQKQQLPGNYSEGQIYQAAITDFKGVPSPTPAHVLHILPCLKTSCWICNVNVSHFNSITSTHSGVDGAKEACGAERTSAVLLRVGGPGGGWRRWTAAFAFSQQTKWRKKVQEKWMNEIETPEHGCKTNNNKKKLRHSNFRWATTLSSLRFQNNSTSRS